MKAGAGLEKGGEHQREQDGHFDDDNDGFGTADVGSLHHVEESQADDQNGSQGIYPQIGRRNLVKKFGNIDAERFGNHGN